MNLIVVGSPHALTDGAFRLPNGLGDVGVHRFDTAKLQW